MSAPEPRDQINFFSTNTIAGIAHRAALASLTDADSHLVAAMFSAAWVEAALNELLFEFTYRDEGVIDPELRELRRTVLAADLFEDEAANVDLKLQMISAATTGKLLDKSVTPWDRLTVLLRLRNWIVHHRPETIRVRPGREGETSSLVNDEVNKLVRSLHSAKAIREIPMGQLVAICQAARLPDVGSWSYRTAYSVLSVVASWHEPWRKYLLGFAHEPITLP